MVVVESRGTESDTKDGKVCLDVFFISITSFKGRLKRDNKKWKKANLYLLK